MFECDITNKFNTEYEYKLFYSLCIALKINVDDADNKFRFLNNVQLDLILKAGLL